MCPPGVDQTFRSPQHWTILVPERRQRIAFGSSYHYDYDTKPRLFHHSSHWDAWGLLARPDPPTTGASNDIGPIPQPNKSNSPSPSSCLTAFFSLPKELHHQILSFLPLPSILSLALSHPFLHSLVTSTITHSLIACSAAWANTPIALTGNYLRTLPLSFLNDNLAYGSVNMNITSGESRATRVIPRVRHPRGMCDARRMFWSAMGSYEEVGPSAVMNESVRQEESEGEYPMATRNLLEWRRALEEVSTEEWFERQGGESLREVVNMHRAFGLNDNGGGDGVRDGEANVWYLRNLDTKEVVQCLPSVDEKTGHIVAHVGSPRLQGPKFQLRKDTVLSMKTRWCSNKLDTKAPSTEGPEQEERKTREGSWAGHRFDIVSQKRHAEEARRQETGWEDVTLTVLQEAAVWRFGYIKTMLEEGKRGKGDLAIDELLAKKVVEEYDPLQFLEELQRTPGLGLLDENEGD